MDLCSWCGVPIGDKAGARFRIRGGSFEAKGTICMGCLKAWKAFVDSRKLTGLTVNDLFPKGLS